MDTEAVLDLCKRTAAQVITPRFRALADGEVMEKAPGDLVTVADQEAEVLITDALAAAYPDAVILGEEATAADPSRLAAFATASHAFTIDPIDGTANFVKGSADHAVMVAELREGTVVRSWIWAPEHQQAFVAELGGGAYLNGQRLPRREIGSDPARWHGVSSNDRVRSATAPPLQPVGPTWFCAGIDYAKVAQGEADFVVFSHTKAWDHAPGSLLVCEVGGATMHPDGVQYAPTQPRPWLICGASAAVADGARAALAATLS